MAEVASNLQDTVRRMGKTYKKIRGHLESIENYEQVKSSQGSMGFNTSHINDTIDYFVEEIDQQAHVMSDLIDNLKGKL